ncbi:MAG: hypothetical protein LBU32_11685 [Clostridiales bacterium]|nr:hypothetical protein [Clostridiales bacterium]
MEMLRQWSVLSVVGWALGLKAVEPRKNLAGSAPAAPPGRKAMRRRRQGWRAAAREAQIVLPQLEAWRTAPQAEEARR